MKYDTELKQCEKDGSRYSDLHHTSLCCETAPEKIR